MRTTYHSVSKGKRLQKWIRMTLGFYLKEERLMRNLQIEDVALEIPIYSQHIENIEQGIGSTQWNVICTLLRFYKKDIKIELINALEK